MFQGRFDRRVPGSTGPNFGRRAEDKKPRPATAEPTRVDRCTTIDFVRSVAAGLIHKWEIASPQDRSAYFIQIRTIQDEISAMHHKRPHLAAQPSALSWVDLWSPRE